MYIAYYKYLFMGRFEKVVLDKKGIDKRSSGYYSTPKFISDYISNQLLELNPFGRKVLDPAVGEEELLHNFHEAQKEIDSFDIIRHKEYTYSNFTQRDFIEYFIELKEKNHLDNEINLDYDYYIANPPYNCHELDFIRNNKTVLKKTYESVGVNNMYSMFLSSMISLAKEGALIGVIISDSFLTAKMHAGLRQQIIESCSIHQLLLCPSDLFWKQKADVRTCIIILQKGKDYQKNISILNRPDNTDQLKMFLSTKDFISVQFNQILLSSKKSSNQFIIDVDSKILKLFENKRIGQVYKCITGISTGNDKKYLSKVPKDGYSIPFYKNPGSRKFTTQPDAYLIDDFLAESKKVKDFMVRNKTFVFKEGITCSSMGLPFSACYLPENSTYGVNPNIFTPKEDLYWMISYLNSHLITYLVRGVLIRSNMVTSGYISQLPIITFSDSEKHKLSLISKQVLNNTLKADEAVHEVNSIVYQNLGLNEGLILEISNFANNLSKNV